VTSETFGAVQSLQSLAVIFHSSYTLRLSPSLMFSTLVLYMPFTELPLYRNVAHEISVQRNERKFEVRENKINEGYEQFTEENQQLLHLIGNSCFQGCDAVLLSAYFQTFWGITKPSFAGLSSPEHGVIRPPRDKVGITGRTLIAIYANYVECHGQARTKDFSSSTVGNDHESLLKSQALLAN